ncbi:uncharacterized [Tachysurus ichikawai]
MKILTRGAGGTFKIKSMETPQMDMPQLPLLTVRGRLSGPTAFSGDYVDLQPQLNTQVLYICHYAGEKPTQTNRSAQ